MTVPVTHSGLTTENLRARNSGWQLIVLSLRVHVDQQGQIGRLDQAARNKAFRGGLDG